MPAEIHESGFADRLVAGGLQTEPVALTGADVPIRPELRPRPREGEVDVEEHRLELRHRPLPYGASRGVAQPGSALRSGRRGPQFESGHPDFLTLATRMQRQARGRWPSEASYRYRGVRACRRRRANRRCAA